MKLRYITILEIDLKDLLLARSVSTIRRKITGILGESDETNAIISKAREIAGFIKADADATLRLIESRPDREDDYLNTWALCSDKHLQVLRQMILAQAKKSKTKLDIEEMDPCFEAVEIRAWSGIDEPKPSPNPNDGTPELPGTEEAEAEAEAEAEEEEPEPDEE